MNTGNQETGAQRAQADTLDHMTLRFNLEIDVTELRVIDLKALTGRIAHACGLERTRLISVRLPRVKL